MDCVSGMSSSDYFSGCVIVVVIINAATATAASISSGPLILASRRGVDASFILRKKIDADPYRGSEPRLDSTHVEGLSLAM
ncbi:hypothetical protein F4778DRAFT_754995 [Xylariomycetidae sp. FL2044]|nr:hypothetical protein F4778DRAFT_754995 [Xylariomycetidae sp. FL2044]